MTTTPTIRMLSSKNMVESYSQRMRIPKTPIVQCEKSVIMQERYAVEPVLLSSTYCILFQILVKIEPGVNTNKGAVKRPGIRDLPGRASLEFSTRYGPLLILTVGNSGRPWDVPGEETRKKIWMSAFPDIDFPLDKILKSPVCVSSLIFTTASDRTFSSAVHTSIIGEAQSGR